MPARASSRDVKETDPLKWDDYHAKKPEEALPKLYALVLKRSQGRRDWYWRSIHSHRRMSAASRWLSYLLGVAGVAAPLISALFGEAEERLFWTQLGVAALAVAGLVQLGDRVFGFSSGWMRYITTVTGMERLAGCFQMDWAQFFLSRDAGALTEDDVETLFALAKKFDDETRGLQEQETTTWVAEFNSSMATLDEMLRLQKEAAEKTLDAVTRDAKPGAVEIVVAQPLPLEPLTVRLDDLPEETFTGTSWATKGVAPGLHTLRVVRAGDGRIERRTVSVKPNGVSRVFIDLAGAPEDPRIDEESEDGTKEIHPT